MSFEKLPLCPCSRPGSDLPPALLPLPGRTVHTGTSTLSKNSKCCDCQHLKVLPSRDKKGQKLRTLWHNSQAKPPPPQLSVWCPSGQKAEQVCSDSSSTYPSRLQHRLVWGLLCVPGQLPLHFPTSQLTPLLAICPLVLWTGAIHRATAVGSSQLCISAAALSSLFQNSHLLILFPVPLFSIKEKLFKRLPQFPLALLSVSLLNIKF